MRRVIHDWLIYVLVSLPMISPTPKTVLSYSWQKESIIFLRLNKCKQILGSESVWNVSGVWFCYFSAATGSGTNLLAGCGFSRVRRTGQLSVNPEGEARATDQNFTEQSRFQSLKLICIYSKRKKWGFDIFPK